MNETTTIITITKDHDLSEVVGKRVTWTDVWGEVWTGEVHAGVADGFDTDPKNATAFHIVEDDGDESPFYVGDEVTVLT